jgi:hypothetical protein
MNITENVKGLLQELAKGNCYGEPVTLVAATKMQSPENINEAIRAGVKDIGENWVQEFKEKYDAVEGGNRHFIGHLQTNKVKYLIGKTYLYHSLDRTELAEEISKRSQKAGIVSDVLIQINIGCEESKGGFDYDEGFSAYKQVAVMPAVRVLGFMAMLPVSEDKDYLLSLVKKMRALYERAKAEDENIRYLSMGMSGDYGICLQGGSNMVRIGTTIFGHRNYDR